MPKKYDTPILPNDLVARIGRQPFSSEIGMPLAQQRGYVNNHLGQGQLMAFSGPGWTMDDDGDDTVNPDYDYDFCTPTYPVIMCAPPKTDTSNPYRQLGGVLVPHHIVPHTNEAYGVVTCPGRVTWESPLDTITGEQTIFQTDRITPEDWANLPESLTAGGGVPGTAFHRSNVEPIELHNYRGPDLSWDGNMEASHFLAFGISPAHAITKDTSTYFNGSQSLKVDYVSSPNPAVLYPRIPGSPDGYKLTAGCKYYIKARVAGDGTSTPRILQSNGSLIVAGTTSTSWQPIEGEFVASGDYIQLQTLGSTHTFFDSVEIYELGQFKYEPESDGDLMVGYLRTYRMRVAALSVWSMPDVVLTSDQAVFDDRAFDPGQAIRGAESSRPSLGDMIDFAAYNGSSSLDEDTMERNTRRCLLNITHPLGIKSELQSFNNIRSGEDSYFRINARDLGNKGSSATQTQKVAAVLSASEYGGIVKLTSIGTSDTCTLGTTASNTLQFKQDELETTQSDKIEVEIISPLTAPVDSWVRLHGLSMFEGRWDDVT